MPWLSKKLRRSPPSRVTLTAIRPPASFGDGSRLDTLEAWFAEFDDRNLPVTWGVVSGDGTLPLGPSMLASQVPHELAIWPIDAGKLHWENIRKQAALAHRVKLPLRSMLSPGNGVHPSLLASLGVEALVSLPANNQRSRTGSARAIAWNMWEIPVTDVIQTGCDGADARHLLTRLGEVSRQSTRMHLLVELSGRNEYLLRFLDRLVVLRHRGRVAVETVGMAAEEASRRAGKVAA